MNSNPWDDHFVDMWDLYFMHDSVVIKILTAHETLPHNLFFIFYVYFVSLYLPMNINI